MKTASSSFREETDSRRTLSLLPTYLSETFLTIDVSHSPNLVLSLRLSKETKARMKASCTRSLAVVLSSLMMFMHTPSIWG